MPQIVKPEVLDSGGIPCLGEVPVNISGRGHVGIREATIRVGTAVAASFRHASKANPVSATARGVPVLRVQQG